MTRLTEIFQSKAQVRLVEYLLQNSGKQKLFNQAALARFLNVSPSTIARIIEPLVKQKIVLFERFERGMKILALNEEEDKTRVLIEFYEKLRRL